MWSFNAAFILLSSSCRSAFQWNGTFGLQSFCKPALSSISAGVHLLSWAAAPQMDWMSLLQDGVGKLRKASNFSSVGVMNTVLLASPTTLVASNTTPPYMTFGPSWNLLGEIFMFRALQTSRSFFILTSSCLMSLAWVRISSTFFYNLVGFLFQGQSGD